jgi:glutamine synthetase
MHVHMSISKGGKNLMAGDGYAGLSETAIYMIGGIIKHARAINAFTNPGTNSYKRLVPGYEAPVMLAGLDGIQNKIHPGDAMDKDLYDLEPEEAKSIPTVCHALDMALDYLDKDRAFLTAGGVFTDDLIDAYIALKMDEVTRMRMTTHPIEYDMYYSL